jgi:hypothetical protein
MLSIRPLCNALIKQQNKRYKTYQRLGILLACVFLGLSFTKLAVGQQAPKKEDAKTPIGFFDKDRNGVNDGFYDANGDGVNDVTDKPYSHPFRFADKNSDGINDLFIDQDGDGVNDLKAHFEDADKDGVCDNLIDMDSDGRNDITGLQYNQRSLRGFRYGKVDEERQRLHDRFMDRDGDGMHDPLRRIVDPLRQESMDRFIDEDGDGIADHRRLHGRPDRPLPPHLRERLKKRPPRQRPRPPRRGPPDQRQPPER